MNSLNSEPGLNGPQAAFGDPKVAAALQAVSNALLAPGYASPASRR